MQQFRLGLIELRLGLIELRLELRLIDKSKLEQPSWRKFVFMGNM
jgi:hypothetical protein